MIDEIIESYLLENKLNYSFFNKVNDTYLYISKNKKKLFKIKEYNDSTKTLKEEFDAISFLQQYSFTPRVYEYHLLNEDKNIEGIILEYIQGKPLSQKKYYEGLEVQLLKYLKMLYLDKVQHGDIKCDNILIKGKEIFLIDFNQVKIYENIEEKFHNFWLCEDIVGNIYNEDFQMNYKQLRKQIEQWKR